jgi:hypothetical protein
MNFKLLLIAIAAVTISSCSTAYKSGQTPDDVYYSPVRGIDEREDRREDRVERRSDVRTDNYEEREIRMATRDRRWRDINDEYDYNYRYDPYRYGYNHGYYYNPYYYNQPIWLPGYAIVNPKNTTPRMTNLGSYNNSTLVTADPKSGETKWIKAERSYNNSNNSNSGSNRNAGSFVRRILTTPASTTTSSSTNRNSGYSNDNNNRTYTPATNNNNNSSSGSSSSGSSSSGSSGSSVPRPTRGN